MNPVLLRSTLLGIIVSALLAILKFIAGIMGDSYALIADAIESTTDVFSSSLLLIGLWFAQQPADSNHPYGHGRAETLATFIIVGFLITSASIIVIESIQHILTPHKAPKPFTLVVLLIVVVVKEALSRHLKKVNPDSSAMEAESWHHRSDAITSLASFLGISLSLFMGDGWESADDWAAIVAGGIIYFNAWHIFRPALGDMMDEDRFTELREQILTIVLNEKEVLTVEECLVRKMGSHYIVDLRIKMNNQFLICQAYELTNRLKLKIMENESQIKRVFVELCV